MAGTHEPRNWTRTVAKKKPCECLFGKNVDRACVAIPRVNPYEEDTRIRMEIQEKIKQLILKGWKPETILSRLKMERKYSKYKQYFESWIEHAIKKAETKHMRDEKR